MGSIICFFILYGFPFLFMFFYLVNKCKTKKELIECSLMIYVPIVNFISCYVLIFNKKLWKK